MRDPAAAAKVGDLAREHQNGAERLRRVAQVIDSVLADREVLRQNVDTTIRDFIEQERRHLMMEDRDVFPAALKALKPQDWTEIASAVAGRKDPLFSDIAEEQFDALRAHILRLEQEAQAERIEMIVPTIRGLNLNMIPSSQGLHVNNIWLKASQCLTYRRVVLLSVTEITGAPQWQPAFGYTLAAPAAGRKASHSRQRQIALNPGAAPAIRGRIVASRRRPRFFELARPLVIQPARENSGGFV
jgi:hemerythrin HHE cation binding domain-containing protein